jgi:hypothetical protein
VFSISVDDTAEKFFSRRPGFEEQLSRMTNSIHGVRPAQPGEVESMLEHFEALEAARRRAYKLAQLSKLKSGGRS